jgi:hypothetical protein
MMNYSIEFNAYTIDGLTNKDFRFSIYGISVDLVGEYRIYEPRIVTTSTVTTSMFSDRTTSGANSKTYGYLELENSDGALDYMVDYAMEGSVVAITFYLDDGSANGYITNIVIDSVEFSMTKVVINLRDVIVDLDRSLLTAVYGGTNVLPNGIDGTDDIKGQTIPRALGFVKSVEPVLVNTSILVYQISDKTGTIQNVYDKGVALALQTPAFSSVADMMTGSVSPPTPPSPGNYRVYNGPEGLFFKLGVAPNGIVTCDVKGDTLGGVGTVGEIISDILAAGSFTQSFAATLPAYEAGIYIKDSSSYKTLVTELCESVGSWFGSSDFSNNINGGVFDPTTGLPVGYFDSSNILDIERVRTRDTGNGVPIWRVNFNYQKIDRVLTVTELAASVSNADKNYLAKEYRTVVVENAAIKTLYPNSEELTITSLLTDVVDATAEANRLLALYGQKRVVYVVTFKDPYIASLLGSYSIGNTATLQLDRFGLDFGENFSIIGLETDYYSLIAKITLWG